MGENSDQYWNTRHELRFIRLIGVHTKEHHRLMIDRRIQWLHLRKKLLVNYISVAQKRKWEGNYDLGTILRTAKKELLITLEELGHGKDTPGSGRNSEVLRVVGGEAEESTTKREEPIPGDD